MTRINLIPPEELSRQHLIAEYRELPRIPNAVRKHQALGRSPRNFRIPEDYVLGTGHVTFFYDKMTFLMVRYTALQSEMRRRGYKASAYPTNLFDGLQSEWFRDYQPTPSAIALNRARILERSFNV